MMIMKKKLNLDFANSSFLALGIYIISYFLVAAILLIYNRNTLTISHLENSLIIFITIICISLIITFIVLIFRLYKTLFNQKILNKFMIKAVSTICISICLFYLIPINLISSSFSLYFYNLLKTWLLLLPFLIIYHNDLTLNKFIFVMVFSFLPLNYFIIALLDFLIINNVFQNYLILGIYNAFKNYWLTNSLYNKIINLYKEYSSGKLFIFNVNGGERPHDAVVSYFQNYSFEQYSSKPLIKVWWDIDMILSRFRKESVLIYGDIFTIRYAAEFMGGYPSLLVVRNHSSNYFQPDPTKYYINDVKVDVPRFPNPYIHNQICIWLKEKEMIMKDLYVGMYLNKLPGSETVFIHPTDHVGIGMHRRLINEYRGRYADDILWWELVTKKNAKYEGFTTSILDYVPRDIWEREGLSRADIEPYIRR